MPAAVLLACPFCKDESIDPASGPHITEVVGNSPTVTRILHEGCSTKGLFRAEMVSRGKTSGTGNAQALKKSLADTLAEIAAEDAAKAEADRLAAEAAAADQA